MPETMTTRDAFICYRVLAGIRRAANTQEFAAGMKTYYLLGQLEYRIFGSACCNGIFWE